MTQSLSTPGVISAAKLAVIPTSRYDSARAESLEERFTQQLKLAFSASSRYVSARAESLEERN
ncbi:MAG: hypothetical protein ACLFR1_15200 [Spirochaetia bacterium]